MRAEPFPELYRQDHPNGKGCSASTIQNLVPSSSIQPTAANGRRSINGAGQALQVRRLVAPSLDDLVGELDGAALGGVDGHEPAFELQWVEDHQGEAGRAGFSKAIALGVGGEPNLNHSSSKIAHRLLVWRTCVRPPRPYAAPSLTAGGLKQSQTPFPHPAVRPVLL